MDLRKLKRFFFGPRAGTSLSLNVAESDHSPAVQPFPSEVDKPEALREPDMDGWVRQPNGDRIRKIRNGMGSEMIDDNRPVSRVAPGWQKCRGCQRREPERLRGGLCDWCRGE